MLKELTSIVIDGYLPNQTDFRQRLNECPSEIQDEFKRLIIDPLLAVVESFNQTPRPTAALTIGAHSDRLDSPALSREECRIQEVNESIARVKSADLGIFQILSETSPLALPADWADLDNVAITTVYAGAANLIHSSDALSDFQRQQNRRVIISLVCFLP